MFLLVSAVQQCKSAISVYICIPYVLIYISHMYINIYPICAYIYICLPSPVSLPSSHHLHPSPAGRHSMWSWAPCVTQQLPLALYFTYGSVYMSVLLSQIFFFKIVSGSKLIGRCINGSYVPDPTQAVSLIFNILCWINTCILKILFLPIICIKPCFSSQSI